VEDKNQWENQDNVAEEDDENRIGDVPGVRSESNAEKLSGESDGCQYRQQSTED